jgi:hypothetical protein
MKLLPASSLLLTVVAVAGIALADEARRSHRFDTAGIEHLRIEHRAGEQSLAPAESDQIEVELRIEPQEGHDVDLADLDLESSLRGDILTLSFGKAHVTSHMLVRVPPLKQLTIDAGAGEVQGTLPPMEASVLLGAGTVDLDVDRSSTGRVALRARVGATSIDGAPGAETDRVLLVGSTSSAVGEGAHRVEARVRAGDVRVALR